MPIYNPALKSLDMKEIKRYSGLAQTSEFPPHLLEQVCVEAQILSHPKVVWQIYDYNPSTATIMSPESLTLSSTKISEHLKNCLQVIVIAVTIGSKLEEKVSEYFTKDEYTLGLLLDAAGTTAVEVAADQACDLIRQQANQKGYSTLFRFSPGYGQWDITVQPQILSLAHAHEINVAATPSCMLVPRKSITAVIGLTPNACQSAPASPAKNTTCQQCQQVNCLARKD